MNHLQLDWEERDGILLSEYGDLGFEIRRAYDFGLWRLYYEDFRQENTNVESSFSKAALMVRARQLAQKAEAKVHA